MEGSGKRTFLPSLPSLQTTPLAYKVWSGSHPPWQPSLQMGETCKLQQLDSQQVVRIKYHGFQPRMIFQDASTGWGNAEVWEQVSAESSEDTAERNRGGQGQGQFPACWVHPRWGQAWEGGRPQKGPGAPTLIGQSMDVLCLARVSSVAIIVAPGRTRKWLFAGGAGRMDERRWPGRMEFGDAVMGGPDSGDIDDMYDHSRKT